MQVFKKLRFLPALLLPCQLVMGQAVPIVEAGGDSARGQVVQSSASNNQNEIMVNMYLQLEALQTEVQTLRGLVEEQSYQMRRMQTEQRDRYLDTDSRLMELQNEIRGNSNSGAGQRPITQTPGASAPNRNNPVTAGATRPADTGVTSQSVNSTDIPRTEQEIYRQALALLLENEAYQDSITLFQQYIDVYPQGRYFTNSLYWQGAALELIGNYSQSINVLQRLINDYPSDAKAPTAMLRLGTVYREMGRTPEAIATWRQISELYPDSTSEIEIANEYLSDAGNL